jgi:hypothetical protein
MFESDWIPIETLTNVKPDPSPRLRFTADVNGQRCFIKKFGSHPVQCAVDAPKREVGLPSVGISRAVTTAWGEVLVMRFHPHRCSLNKATPSAEWLEQLTRILLFDVWLLNNDRTGGNVLVLNSGELLPIDESAAFQREPKFNLNAKWRAAFNGDWLDRPAEAWARADSIGLVRMDRV